MNNPGQYPAGWRRSVSNEKYVDEIIRDARDEIPAHGVEFWGEFIAAFCVIALPFAMLFIFYVLGV